MYLDTIEAFSLSFLVRPPPPPPPLPCPPVIHACSFVATSPEKNQLTMLIPRVSSSLPPPPLHPLAKTEYGEAGWTSGENDEPADDHATVTVPVSESSMSDAVQSNVLQKAFLFGLILAAVALYLRFATPWRQGRQGQGYQKVMA